MNSRKNSKNLQSIIFNEKECLKNYEISVINRRFKSLAKLSIYTDKYLSELSNLMTKKENDNKKYIEEHKKIQKLIENVDINDYSKLHQTSIKTGFKLLADLTEKISKKSLNGIVKQSVFKDKIDNRIKNFNEYQEDTKYTKLINNLINENKNKKKKVINMKKSNSCTNLTIKRDNFFKIKYLFYRNIESIIARKCESTKNIKTILKEPLKLNKKKKKIENVFLIEKEEGITERENEFYKELKSKMLKKYEVKEKKKTKIEIINEQNFIKLNNIKKLSKIKVKKYNTSQDKDKIIKTKFDKPQLKLSQVKDVLNVTCFKKPQPLNPYSLSKYSNKKDILSLSMMNLYKNKESKEDNINQKLYYDLNRYIIDNEKSNLDLVYSPNKDFVKRFMKYGDYKIQPVELQSKNIRKLYETQIKTNLNDNKSKEELYKIKYFNLKEFEENLLEVKEEINFCPETLGFLLPDEVVEQRKIHFLNLKEKHGFIDKFNYDFFDAIRSKYNSYKNQLP